MYDIMKKLFLLLAIATFSLLTMAQTNQIVWNNGQLLYGTPIETIDSLTYGEMNEIDTFHLILPRTIVKVVYDTVYVHEPRRKPDFPHPCVSGGGGRLFPCVHG